MVAHSAMDARRIPDRMQQSDDPGGDRSPVTDRILDRLAALGAFALVLGLLLPFLFTRLPPPAGRVREPPLDRLARNVVSVMYDDGFYYLEIARNVAEGHGSTFDGLHPTNGYHPLWLLTLVPVVGIAGSREAALVGLFLLQAVLTGAAAVLVYRTARAFGARPLASALAPLAFAQHQATYWMALSGMEYGLQCLLLCALGLGVAREGETVATPRRVLIRGLLAALAVLARLDNALLVALLGIEMHRRWARGGARIATFLLPSALLVGGYLTVNLWLFGHAFPVSGLVKADWSAELLARDPVARSHVAAKLANFAWPFAHMPRSYLLLPCLGLGVALAILIVSPRALPGVRRLRPLAAFAWLQVLAYAWIYHGGFSFQPWYFAVQPWLGAVALGVGGEALLRATGGRRRTLATAAAALALPGVSAALLALSARNVGLERERQVLFIEGDPHYAAALWVRDHTPRDAVIGSWNAGLMATLSGRTVVNLDGLVNSWDFYRRRRQDPCRYWHEERITLLVDVFDPGSPPGGAAAASCASGLRSVWVGPAYAGSGRRAGAFLLPQPR